MSGVTSFFSFMFLANNLHLILIFSACMMGVYAVMRIAHHNFPTEGKDPHRPKFRRFAMHSVLFIVGFLCFYLLVQQYFV